jgi:hypothetical protein
VSPKDLKAILKILRTNGVVSYKSDGTELLLSPDAFLRPAPKRAKGDGESLQSQVDSVAGAFGSMPNLSREEWLLATNGNQPELSDEAN